jgi:hypothetical protein
VHVCHHATDVPAHQKLLSSVVYPHHVDADPDQTFHPYADPDPDPDPDPSFKKKGSNP